MKAFLVAFAAAALALVISIGVGIGCASLVGCAALGLEDAAAPNSDDAKLAGCRAEARSAMYVDQKSAKESIAIFDACVTREGLRK